jgi:hypothetical protein
MPKTDKPLLRVVACFAIAASMLGCSASAPSGQTPASAAPGAAAPSTSAPASDTTEPSTIAEPTSAASDVTPSLGAGTPLVDLLPAELGGAATTKFSFVGSDLSAIDPSAVMIFDGVIQQLGAKSADMTIGTASNGKASVIAIRVAGKSAQQIGDAMMSARTLNATTTKDELDLSGKHVVKVTTTIAPLPFYIYGAGDVSFTIAGADESIVAEALSKLP